MGRLWLIAGVLSLATLLIAAVVVSLMGSEQPMPDGTPERTVQRFLTALQAEYYRLAYSFWSDSRKEICELTDLVGGDALGVERYGNARVVLKDTKIFDDAAVVIASITRIENSGPFGTSEHSEDQSYDLVKEQGEWRIDGRFWPHMGCVNSTITP